MIVPAAICTTAHANDPFRIRHLIVALSYRRGHLVGYRAGYYHDIGLTRGGAKDDSQAVLVVSGHRDVHHFDTAAGKTKR